MRSIFEQGYFQTYSSIRLDEAKTPVMNYAQYGINKTTVFISHKHNDLEDLKGVLGFLEKTYGVKAYIDSKDPTMPVTTSVETAQIIKRRIKECNKFIFLATNGAIESKWCNWELGYGDALKYQDHIALFPFKPKGARDYEYAGSEYMNIYPFISYYDGSEHYKSSNKLIDPGFYVVTRKDDLNYITPLKEWFENR